MGYANTPLSTAIINQVKPSFLKSHRNTRTQLQTDEKSLEKKSIHTHTQALHMVDIEIVRFFNVRINAATATFDLTSIWSLNY